MAALFLSPPTTTPNPTTHHLRRGNPILFTAQIPSTVTRRAATIRAAATTTTTTPNQSETVFFDGGAHYGDLLANLAFGVTLLWLPLTIAAVSRALFLRYRFTDLRVTVISGFTGRDRTDFPYTAVKEVQVVPRFIGEWGDIVITLTDGTKVDLRSVPRFREVAAYCSSMAAKSDKPLVARPKGF